MNAEIICVGTELLLGNVVNTNSAYLSQKLSQIGINLYFHTVVGDNESRLLSAIEIAAKRSDIIIFTGGLGPTYDDITKETVAKFFSKELYLDGPSLDAIKSYFQKTGRNMTDNNVKQAYVIDGATVFPNAHGTAPGMILEAEYQGKTVISALLPGPPFEMAPMVDNSLIPYLMKKSSTVLYSRTVRIFGVGESRVESELRELMENSTDPTVAPYAKPGEVELRITSAAETVEKADEKIKPVLDLIINKYKDNVYGIDVPNLETELVNRLSANKMTVSFAESCTGGLLAKRVTDVSGASAVIGLSLVTYSNEAKKKLLGVSDSTLKKYGAVSKECAMEMAQGALNVSDADVAVSTTGVAGPDKSEGKDVGLVYVGFCKKGETPTYLELQLSKGRKNTRDHIRTMAGSSALFNLLKLI